MDFRDFARIGLEKERLQLKKLNNVIKNSPEGRLVLRKNVNGHRRYYITLNDSDKQIYANGKMLLTVYKLKQRRKAEIKARLMANNISVREYVIENYQDCSDDAIEEMLPNAYRCDDELNAKINIQKVRGRQIPQSENPYKTEELKHITSFNLRVRSKAEVIIAEVLYASGLTFYYEKRLDDREYMLRDMRKTQLYYNNRIFEPHNLIVTTDGPDGMTDVEAIHRIIDGLLMPLTGI